MGAPGGARDDRHVPLPGVPRSRRARRGGRRDRRALAPGAYEVRHLPPGEAQLILDYTGTCLTPPVDFMAFHPEPRLTLVTPAAGVARVGWFNDGADLLLVSDGERMIRRIDPPLPERLVQRRYQPLLRPFEDEIEPLAERLLWAVRDARAAALEEARA